MSQAKTADRRQMTHCSNGHDLETNRRRTPAGQTYCVACKREARQRRSHPKLAAAPVSAEVVGLLREGLVMQATSAEMQAWQRKVFALFGRMARERAA